MHKEFPSCLAANEYFIQNHSKVAQIESHLTSEQRFLHKILTSYTTTVKQLRKEIYCIKKNQLIDQLCVQYSNLVNVTAVNLKSMSEYYNGTISCQDIIVLMNCNEMISVYRAYTKSYCEVMVLQQFQTIDEILEKKNIEDRTIFSLPLRRIWNYIEFICDLMKSETNEVYQTFLLERKSVWEKCKNEKDLTVERATNTKLFWERTGKSLISKLQTPERRLVLDSKDFTLKVLPSSRFSTPWVLLFNDLFCHYLNGQMQVYPLKTVWTSSINDNDNRKNVFKLITPEETYVLTARVHEDKQRWLDAIELGIKQSLDKPNSVKVPQYRNASYTFSEKHQKFPSVKYFGRWCSGQMQGIGLLEFSDGKSFNGQMTNGDINGFGKMYTPSLGHYDGDFLNGKYHGYGVLKMINQELYEGHFKEGLFYGHGVITTAQYTYIGEFVAGQKCGYGVLDDSVTGEKYMGMFVDNKRIGFGISITMDGKYFEGMFAGDLLAGEGVAVFENGSYYEGELTAFGPNGKGTLFLPELQVKLEVITCMHHICIK